MERGALTLQLLLGGQNARGSRTLTDSNNKNNLTARLQESQLTEGSITDDSNIQTSRRAALITFDPSLTYLTLNITLLSSLYHFKPALKHGTPCFQLSHLLEVFFRSQ